MLIGKDRMGGRAINANTKLLINGELKQILGVTPASFSGLAVGERFDIALPFCQPKQLMRNLFDVTVMGRLRPGWTVQRASAQLAAQSPGIMAATEITGYGSSTVERYRKFRLAAYPAAAGVSNLRNQYDSSLWLLLTITGLVLLIACANLANLLLARASAREREIAVRLALGAGRVRLLRQLLVESGLLAVTGALLGVGLAELLSRVLVSAISTEDYSLTLPMGIDWRVLLFAAGVAAVTCVIFGAAPALRASGADPVIAMKEGGRGLTTGRERFSLQRVMVVTQIAVSLLLLVGALLFVRSFRNLMMFNPGFREGGITVAYIGFQESKFGREHPEEFKRALLEDVRSTPGVRDAASTTMVPLLGGSWTHRVPVGTVEGDSKFTWVSPDYFETLGVPLLTGRAFNENDTGSSQRVAVVNQIFVRDFMHGRDPIGQTIRTHPEPDYPATIYEVIGVIPDTKYSCLRCGTPPMAFAPDAQFPAQFMDSDHDLFKRIAHNGDRFGKTPPQRKTSGDYGPIQGFRNADSGWAGGRPIDGDAVRILWRAGGATSDGWALRSHFLYRDASAQRDWNPRRTWRKPQPSGGDGDARGGNAAGYWHRDWHSAFARRRTRSQYPAVRVKVV